ncbi:MAG TPA: EAL domain-containing protein [Actinomycetota bacterium]|nr:EAL domain-containing protein [Actinomycetota bacterium]
MAERPFPRGRSTVRDPRTVVARVGEHLNGHRDQDRRLRAVEAEVRDVLRGGGPRIVFQPIVDLRNGDVVGLEALSRFTGSHRPPLAWFEAARQVGLGCELELLALRRARAACAAADGIFLAVNLSPETLVSPAFLELLDGEDHRLVIEATEHAPVHDYDALARPLRTIKEKGARLAVDDAGAGFASLRHVLRLAPDLIKLDIELTRQIDSDRAKRALAAGLIAFAEELPATIVAEGIETREQLDELRELGVTLGQGFYLCPPSTIGDIDPEAVAERAVDR